MIKIDVKQLSPEWYTLRAGLPSCSNFDKIVTTKGIRSNSAEKYLYQLAGERVSGIKEDSYQNAAMLRGIELEPEAISLYEFLTDTDVERIGLCYKDEKKLVGGSPDVLVGSNGGIEVKCPSLAVHVEYLLKNKLPTVYFQQVQGYLWLTGRKWWDFVSYYPGIRPFIFRVNRDESFISALEFELKVFCAELEKIVEKIK